MKQLIHRRHQVRRVHRLRARLFRRPFTRLTTIIFNTRVPLTGHSILPAGKIFTVRHTLNFFRQGQTSIRTFSFRLIQFRPNIRWHRNGQVELFTNKAQRTRGTRNTRIISLTRTFTHRFHRHNRKFQMARGPNFQSSRHFSRHLLLVPQTLRDLPVLVNTRHF